MTVTTSALLMSSDTSVISSCEVFIWNCSYFWLIGWEQTVSRATQHARQGEKYAYRKKCVCKKVSRQCRPSTVGQLLWAYCVMASSRRITGDYVIVPSHIGHPLRSCYGL
jgi:hypothetical protein